MEINRISDHAVDKYCNYMKIMHDKEVYLNIAKEQIKKLFDKAIPELSSGLVRRVIDNDFIDAEYYRYMGWRFVVCNCTIVTIERNIFGKSKKANFKKINRNFRKSKRIKDIQLKRR